MPNGNRGEMARVNVERELFEDRRFQKLMIKLGSTEAAVGAVVLAWMVAQKFWLHSDLGIPKPEWIKQELKNEIIEVGLAEDLNDFVRIVGSEKHFAWIRECSKAGKSSAEKRKTAKSEIIDDSVQPPLTEVQGSSTSFLLSPSSLLSSPDSSLISQKKKIAPSVSTKPLEAVRCRPEFESIAEVIRERGITEELQTTWLAAFPDSSWIISEVRKALAWEAANPAKKKKRFGAFMTNWMNKGWDRRNVTQSGAPSKRSVMDILKEAGK